MCPGVTRMLSGWCKNHHSGEIWEIEFPQSCVLYVRNHRSLPQYHEAIVRFSDGQQVHYRIPIIHAQHYTVNDMFEKKLLILLPYHILRYEHFLKSNKTNKKRLNQLLDDYRKINERLTDTCEKEKKSEFYKDMICLIKEIADHVIPKENEARKGMDDIMGGKVLTLPLNNPGRNPSPVRRMEITNPFCWKSHFR